MCLISLLTTVFLAELRWTLERPHLHALHLPPQTIRQQQSVAVPAVSDCSAQFANEISGVVRVGLFMLVAAPAARQVVGLDSSQFRG